MNPQLKTSFHNSHQTFMTICGSIILFAPIVEQYRRKRSFPVIPKSTFFNLLRVYCFYFCYEDFLYIKFYFDYLEFPLLRYFWGSLLHLEILIIIVAALTIKVDINHNICCANVKQPNRQYRYPKKKIHFNFTH